MFNTPEYHAFKAQLEANKARIAHNAPIHEQFRREQLHGHPHAQGTMEDWLKAKVLELKATGGVAHLSIGGQGPRNWVTGSVEKARGMAIGGQPRNWLKGELDPVLNSLKQGSYTDEQLAGLKSASENPNVTAAARAQMTEAHRAATHRNAISKWVEGNLGNYIRKQMATPEDPIRKLAEQGIVHMPNENNWAFAHRAQEHRGRHSGEQLGESEAAKLWENRSDLAMEPTTIQGIRDLSHLFGKEVEEPWMKKADPNTPLMMRSDDMSAHYLGFDHLVDILKEDLANGRIRPEQLKSVSIEHAVRRAHEYDQEQARKMREASLKATEGMPVHKDYGNGYKWIELAMPEPTLEEGEHSKYLPEVDMWGIYDKNGAAVSSGATEKEAMGLLRREERNKQLQEALKYEGDTMGHCVGGYCPSVASGETRIFSLRDEKNEPHVTIETKPGVHPIGFGAKSNEFPTSIDYGKYHDNPPYAPTQEQLQEILVRAKNYWDQVQNIESKSGVIQRAANEVLGKTPESIKQIKGKQNRKPNPQYIPYVQDFIKSGNWNDIGDFQNTDLVDMEKEPTISGHLQRNNIPYDRFMPRKDFDKHSDNYLLNQLGVTHTAAEGGIIRKAEELAKFLKDSKIKDRLYHATHGDFNKFQNNFRGVHFVTPDPEFANDFLTNSGQNDHEEGANVMPVYVHAKNPFDYENKHHVNALATKASIGKIGVDQIKQGDWNRIEDRTTLQAIKDLGHDSVYVNEGGVKNLGVFDPRHIKSAIGNRGTYDPNDPDITKAHGGLIHKAEGGSMNRKPLTGFTGGKLYSALDQAAKSLKRGVGTGAEFLQELRAMGVKPTEVNERGLMNMANEPRMTKDEFLRKIGHAPTFERIIKAYQPEDYNPSELDTTKYHEYKSDYPGMGNYREKLVSLYRPQLISFDEPPDPQFKSPHWEEPNVVAHARLQDLHHEGNKYLHVDEIQSDWHQKGRKRGYKTLEEHMKDTRNVWKEYKLLEFADRKAKQAMKPYMDKDASEVPLDLRRRHGEIQLKLQAVRDRIAELYTHTPDAPFKKNWHEMMLKDLLLDAVKGGYRGLTILPGEDQADRYSLTKHISDMAYDPKQKLFEAWDPSREKVVSTRIEPSGLEEHIGSELTKKLLATDPEMGFGKHLLSGEDIKVGGEGMKGFYDKIIPDYLNKLGKKYGVKVGQIRVPADVNMTSTPNAFPQYLEQQGISNQQFADLPIEERINLIEQASQHYKNQTKPLHFFPITDEMRKDISSQGLPLYRSGGSANKDKQ